MSDPSFNYLAPDGTLYCRERCAWRSGWKDFGVLVPISADEFRELKLEKEHGVICPDCGYCYKGVEEEEEK